MLLTDEEELRRVVAAATQKGRVDLLEELTQMLHKRVHWPGFDLWLELLSGIADREADRAALAGAPSGAQRRAGNGHF